MNILGIGPLELFFVILIALIILGPKDMIKTGKTLGRTLNNIIRSPYWKTMQRASQEIKEFPTKLMREANLEDTLKDLPTAQSISEQVGYNKLLGKIKDDQDLSDWLNTPDQNGSVSDSAKIPPDETADDAVEQRNLE